MRTRKANKAVDSATAAPSAPLRQYSELAVSEVAKELRRRSPSQRQGVVRLAQEALQDPRRIRDEDFRIGAVKVLVASVPASLEIIFRLLKDFSKPSSYEVHFTIFCFLDDLLYPSRHLKASKQTLERILSVLEVYLREVPNDTAYAAWMAGHLLGDHWAKGRAVSVLVRVLTRSDNPVGREAAIQGLDDALRRLHPAKARRVRSVMKEILRHERNNSLKASLRSALAGTMV